MLEDELLGSSKDRQAATVDQFAGGDAVQQGDQCVAFHLGHSRGSRIPEGTADDGCLFQHLALGSRQAVDTRLQEVGQCGRHSDVVQLLQIDAPRAVARQDDPLIDQHMHQLLRIVGIALGAVGDQVSQRLRHVLYMPENLIHQSAVVSRGQWGQIDTLKTGHVGVPIRDVFI